MALNSKWVWQETSIRLGNNDSDNLRLGAKKEIFQWYKHFSNFFPVYAPSSLQTQRHLNNGRFIERIKMQIQIVK